MLKKFAPLALLLLMVVVPAVVALVPADTQAPPAGHFILLDGAKQAVIVYNPDDGEYTAGVQGVRFTLKAHEDLANYLQKATGKKFSVVTEANYKPDPANFPIYVGHCGPTQEAIGPDLAKLDRDGYIVRVEANRVFLAGPMIQGTCWAVQQFLEDNLGVRWLYPGELGTDVPHSNTVVVPTGQKIEQPVILSRLWSGAHIAPGGVEWSFRQRIYYQNDIKFTKGRYEFQHNMSNIFPPDKYFDQHPEYYALVKGKREREGYAHGVNICLSNPDTVTIAAQAAIDYFKANPQAESFSFGPNDGGHWCECENCKKLHLPDTLPKDPVKNPFNYAWSGKGGMSALYYTWLSKIAAIVEKECPGKRIGTIAYSAYTPPPIFNPEIKVDPNILPYMCFCEGDMWQTVNKTNVDYLINQWAQRVKSFGFYDYAYGQGMVLPRLYTPLVQQVIQDAVPKGLRGCYAEVYPDWGTDGPRLSQVAKIWWNPQVDLDADLHDWCVHAFKEAAAPMEEHFRLCSQEWVASKQDKYNARKRPGSVAAFIKNYVFITGWRTAPLEVFTPTILAEHTALFDKAASLVKDEKATQRLAWFRKCWDTGVLYDDAYWAGEGLESYIARGATVEQAALALKKMPASYELDAWTQFAKDRMGWTDLIAFYPVSGDEVKQIKINAVRDQDLGWCAAQIVDAQKQLYKEKHLPAATLPDAVKKEIATLFEDGMDKPNDLYKKSVEKIYTMADEELKKK